jgi:hypothetical protein
MRHNNHSGNQDAQPVKQYRVIGVENMRSRRNWMILSFVQHGAATFDAYSTRRAIESGGKLSGNLRRDPGRPRCPRPRRPTHAAQSARLHSAHVVATAKTPVPASSSSRARTT